MCPYNSMSVQIYSTIKWLSSCTYLLFMHLLDLVTSSFGHLWQLGLSYVWDLSWYDQEVAHCCRQCFHINANDFGFTKVDSAYHASFLCSHTTEFLFYCQETFIITISCDVPVGMTEMSLIYQNWEAWEGKNFYSFFCIQSI